jgi:hypothetical protein
VYPCENASPSDRRARQFGHGGWSQSQLIAIVAAYRRKQWSPQAIALKLGISGRQACAISEHVDLLEQKLAHPADD